VVLISFDVGLTENAGPEIAGHKIVSKQYKKTSQEQKAS